MTVTYTAEVATCRGFGCFLTLLLRWRGSIYKLVWPDLALFLFLYYSLNFTYRYVLNSEQRVVFEKVSEYCETYSNYIPLSFVLGFYISIIMQRWWDQYITIPWPDPIAVYVSSHIHGQDERGRLMRRTVMRYVCLCITMVFSMICPRVKKRFPTFDHFVEAGLMTENEKSIITDLNQKFPNHNKQWLPIVWAASIITRARKEGRIRDDFSVKTIIDELNVMRSKCGRLLNYDSISVPLVYTQVVTLATYSFFITSVIGRQWLDVPDSSPLRSRSNPIDLYFPVFTCLQFFFYMGWLKVAESLINPFGEDDDDFEINWIVDRNIVVSYLIVDEMHHEHPELIKDQYWDQVFPTELPHTIASQPFKEKVPQPSTANIAVSNANTEFINPTSAKMDDLGLVITDDMRDDNQSGIHFLAGRSASRMSMGGSGQPGGWSRVRTVSGGSMTSMSQMGSQGASLHRVGSVASVIKRLFSREPASTPVVDGPPSASGGGGRLPESLSSASLSKMAPSVAPSVTGVAATRIADQVIEEVDEQATITSTMGKLPEVRPTAMSIFQSQMPASDPVPVPSGASRRPVSIGLGTPSAQSLPPTVQVSPTRSSVYPDSVRSAPGFDNFSGSYTFRPRDSISIGSSTDTEENEDEFAKLKEARKQEMERIMLARSISVIAGGGGSPPLLNDPGDEEAIALLDMTTDSKSALLSSPPGSDKPA